MPLEILQPEKGRGLIYGSGGLSAPGKKPVKVKLFCLDTGYYKL
jgi:hypothetical protein